MSFIIGEIIGRFGKSPLVVFIYKICQSMSHSPDTLSMCILLHVHTYQSLSFDHKTWILTQSFHLCERARARTLLCVFVCDLRSLSVCLKYLLLSHATSSSRQSTLEQLDFQGSVRNFVVNDSIAWSMFMLIFIRCHPTAMQDGGVFLSRVSFFLLLL